MTNELPDLMSAQALALVERAKSLGLTWTLRPATMVSAGDTPMVIYDGDTEQLGATALTGRLAAAERVMMMQVPPAGNFIIGRLAPDTTGQVLTEVGLTSNSGFVGTTQTIMLVSGLVTWTEGRAYRVEIEGGTDGTTANAMSDFRIYKGNTTATLITEYYRVPWTTATLVVNVNCSRVLTIPTTVNTEVSLGLSATAGTARLFVANNTPFILRATDVGPASDYPAASAMP